MNTPTPEPPKIPETKKETAAEACRRIIASNPRIKEAPQSGKGYVILGAQPPTKRT